MGNQPIHEPKDFSTELRKLETTDPAHANVFNPLFERLVNNDALLREAAASTQANLDAHTVAADPHTQYAKKSNGKFTGETSFDGGGQVINLKPGSLNHVYMALYRDSANPNVRSGFFGYANSNAKSLTIGNEVTDGDIVFAPNGSGKTVSLKPVSVQVMSDSAQIQLSRTTTASGSMHIGADVDGFHVLDSAKTKKALITNGGDGKFNGGLNVQLKITKSAKDANGKFTIVEYRRPDNTLFLRSVLSNPDSNGNYQTDTWTFYDERGVSVFETKVWTVTYDADGDIISVA